MHWVRVVGQILRVCNKLLYVAVELLWCDSIDCVSLRNWTINSESSFNNRISCKVMLLPAPWYCHWCRHWCRCVIIATAIAIAVEACIRHHSIQVSFSSVHLNSIQPITLYIVETPITSYLLCYSFFMGYDGKQKVNLCCHQSISMPWSTSVRTGIDVVNVSRRLLRNDQG